MLDLKKERELELAWQELEWRKCATDINYFIINYVYIEVETKHDARGRTQFNLWDYQKEALNDYLNNRFVIVLKARQLGFTTLAMAYALWQCLFSNRATILLISKSQDAADKNLGMARFMYSFLPDWMKTRGPYLDGDAAKQMIFKYDDGRINRIKSFAGTKTAGAGETASLVILDEFALMEDPSNTFRTIKSTTDAGGSLIIISTARGGANMFASIYRDARKGLNGFKSIFQPWTASKFITSEEYEAKKRDFASEPWLFYMEYPSTDEEAFRESGRPRFPVIPEYEDCHEFPVHGFFTQDDLGEIHFNEEPFDEFQSTMFHLSVPVDEIDFSQQFVISADPALGVGNDYSAAHILSLTEDGLVNIIGYYHSNSIELSDWSEDLVLAGLFFSGRNQRGALLVPENAGGIGVALIDNIRNKYEYPNLYRYLPPAAAKRRRAPVFGFPMNKGTKPLIINRLAEYMTPNENKEFNILNIHPKLRDELSTFVTRDNGTSAADVGCHDDLVMSLAIGLYVLIEECAVNVGYTDIGKASNNDAEVRMSVADVFDEADRNYRAIQKHNRRVINSFKRGRARRERLLRRY
jgi:hypothetical protein